MEPYTREGLARRDIAVTDENADDEASCFPFIDLYSVTHFRLQEEQDSKKMLQEAAAETHDPSYYNYNLAGILVHRGVADHGHYYSFIKQRDGADVSAAPSSACVEYSSQVDLRRATSGLSLMMT